ncbi:unnamed protein product [Hermetia illucens]|uniref:XRN2-binding (XTBD) domain-containing protein n=1 Tax=Hermetia illucens TaxID=343691 RepID=A0A7R8V2Z8_HERIL|nr:unnamed protein product [Hermetia illucens]
MSFNKNWNIDSYRTEYESEEHWQLRRRFMEVHKNKFPEDELVCLAQVFTNVEFMGCKYPDETMRLVGELSQDVAKERRTRRRRAPKVGATITEVESPAHFHTQIGKGGRRGSSWG